MTLNIALKGTLALGLLTAAIVTISTFFGTNAPAQSNDASHPSSRYQISSWAYPATERSDASHGAYIIDSSNGEVWYFQGVGKPQKIGEVR
jgi:hypothetical protein